MIESLIIMDRYLLNDILEKRDYMRWRIKIDKLNQEYHQRYKLHRMIDKRDCVMCRHCRFAVWNWRRMPNEYSDRIIHIYNECPIISCFESYKCFRWLNVYLPKNY